MKTTSMRVKLRGRYDAYRSAASTLFSITSNDLKLSAALTDATFSTGPSLTDLALSLQKPGSFSVVLDFLKKDVSFHFINDAVLMGRTVRLTYTHGHAPSGKGRTKFLGSSEFNSANGVVVGYESDSRALKVSFLYTHGDMEKRTVVEPSLDLSKNTWEIAATRSFLGRDFLRASYIASSKDLEFQWRRKSKVYGSFKISATFNSGQPARFPRLMAESTWSCSI
ncbi:hypothetical protein HPP92_014206 [Vanilla planifolia]|uniref:Uncharacterized protein n=1 Tax=Vanilla planifolia TaxID=51239 RepID=A0A835QPU4_VANPL|nr:hypothetical protein HPP92_014206 [Vanilla planifolia]